MPTFPLSALSFPSGEHKRQHVVGIYDFVSTNRQYIADILSSRIPKGSIVNYGRRSEFSIVRDGLIIDMNKPGGNMRIQTSSDPVGSLGSSQGHSYVFPDDIITYSNNSKIVMDVVIESFTQYKRDKALEQIL